MAETLPGVAKAKGTMRWTGSWYTAFVSVDPRLASVGTDLNADAGRTTSLNMLRMMGVDLVVEEAIFVGLRIGLDICVEAGYFQGDVYAAVWQVLVTGDPLHRRTRSAERRQFPVWRDGLFQPDCCRGAGRTGSGRRRG